MHREAGTTLRRAFAVYEAHNKAFPPRPPTTFTIFNFRPCPSQVNIYWGEPSGWCNDWERRQNGTLIGSGTEGSVSAPFVCPVGYTATNTTPVSGTGAAGDPRYFEMWCEKRIPLAHPQSCSIGNPIRPDDGSKHQTDVDYTDPRGLLTFSRTYESRRGGFAHNLEVDFVRPVKGATTSCYRFDWTTTDRTGTRVYPKCARRFNPTGTSALVVMNEGTPYPFTWDGSTGTSSAPYNRDRLVAASVGGTQGWLLTRVAERRFLHFDAEGLLHAITRIDGQRVQLNRSKHAIPSVAPGENFLIEAVDSFGRTLALRYSDEGHLRQVIDPDGRAITYEHAHIPVARDNPFARALKPLRITYPDNHSMEYRWDEAEHLTGTEPRPTLLTGIVDANNDRYATFKYHNGNARSTEHAGGVDKISLTDSRGTSGTGNITVTDPLGTVRTWQYSLSAGLPRVTGQSQPGGSGCAAASSAITYDANGNVASRTDFNGSKTCSVSDLTRNLETVRVEGLAASATCTTVTASGATLPAGARKISTQWHPDWNLPTLRAEPKIITTYVYNSQPDPTAGGAVHTCAPTQALLPDGKPIVVLCKKIEQPTTDAQGAAGTSPTSTGTARTWNYSYNEHGQLLTQRDPRDRVTLYNYYGDTTAEHTRGDLQSITNALGHATQYTRYDRSGRVLRSVDPNGTTTRHTYTPRGWLERLEVVLADRSATEVTEYIYDGIGQLKTLKLPDGSRLEYSHDTAHRLTGVTDAAGNTVTYTLDNMGNRREEHVKDSSGTLARTIRRSYDALNRLQNMTGGLP